MMTLKARLWIGATLVLILAFNYGIIGMPLIRKAISLNDKSTTILMNKIKSGDALRTSSEEDYILDIFRREKESITRKLIILNAVSLTVLIVIGSWTLFGLAVRKKK
ncbi:MAG: hypothetical protein PHX20_00850 [Candidatus Omnitrophica bacterium]|nr:hypothetical protein [Candidatus Omnitrophota bacterium]MDD5436079.1 hypothetical protein [Candidatus Omnitrophota bacterium]